MRKRRYFLFLQSDIAFSFSSYHYSLSIVKVTILPKIIAPNRIPHSPICLTHHQLNYLSSFPIFAQQNLWLIISLLFEPLLFLLTYVFLIVNLDPRGFEILL